MSFSKRQGADSSDSRVFATCIIGTKNNFSQRGGHGYPRGGGGGGGGGGGVPGIPGPHPPPPPFRYAPAVHVLLFHLWAPQRHVETQSSQPRLFYSFQWRLRQDRVSHSRSMTNQIVPRILVYNTTLIFTFLKQGRNYDVALYSLRLERLGSV